MGINKGLESSNCWYDLIQFSRFVASPLPLLRWWFATVRLSVGLGLLFFNSLLIFYNLRTWYLEFYYVTHCRVKLLTVQLCI